MGGEPDWDLLRRVNMLLNNKSPLRTNCHWSFSFMAAAATALATVVFIAAVSGLRPAYSRAEDSPVQAEAPAAPASIENAGPRPPADVSEDELAGVVVDENGRPLADVTVDAWHWYPGNEIKTDENGQFRLKGFDPKERVEVLVSKNEYSPQHFPQRPTGAKDWIIVLSQGTYFEGKVVDPDGKPVADADIRATFGPVEGDGVVISDVPFHGKSEMGGAFRLYVPPGEYDIQVSAKGSGVFRESKVAIKANEAKPLPVQLRPGVRFEAHVADSVTGKPVEGFVLWQWRGAKLVGRSDDKGVIVFEDLIPGAIEFSCGGGELIEHESGMSFYQHGPFGRWWSEDAVHEWQRRSIDDATTGWQRNFDDLSFDLKIGMEPVKIVVERGVTIKGRVIDPKGAPVTGATVAPARTGSGNSLTGDTRYSVASDEEGRYHVVLPASNRATYNLIVHDGEYGKWRNWANGVSEPITMEPGESFDMFELQLTEPATIRGRVVLKEPGEGGVGGLDVRAHAFDKRENRYYDPKTQTNEDGTFELKFVRPGKHYVQVEPFWLSAEEAPHGSRVVEVKAGETLEGIELEPSPEARDR